MKSLSSFTDNAEVFPNVKVLPQFFETNLVDSARVVKGFENDPQAYIRIFYYQYLRLCFELENVNYDLYIRKIQEIINNPEFNFLFYEHDDPNIFNDNQAKSLIMQFFGVLGEGHLNILKSLNRYPIMDTIFVHFFRSFLILTGVTDALDSYINRDELLDYLCKSFEVEVQIHGECIKFVQTDIFVYQVHEAAVYMAYMDYEGQNNQLQSSAQSTPVEPINSRIEQQPEKIKQVSVNLTNINPSSNTNDRNKRTLIQDSYIASQFVDFTTITAQNDLTSKAKAARQQSESIDASRQPSQKILHNEVKRQPQQIQSKYTSIVNETSNIDYKNYIDQSKNTGKANYLANNQSSFESKIKDPYIHQLNAKETNSYSSYSAYLNYNEPLIQQPKPIEPVNSYKNYNTINTVNLNTNNNVNTSFQSALSNTQPLNNYQPYQPIPTKDTNLYSAVNSNQNKVLNQQNNSVKTNAHNNAINSTYTGINITNSSYGNNNTTNFTNITSNQTPVYNPPTQTAKNPTFEINKDPYFTTNTAESNSYITNIKTTNNTLNTSNAANFNNFSTTNAVSNFSTNVAVGNKSSFSSNFESNFAAITQTQNVASSTIGKKKPFGLNVSEQFTNENVGKLMAEPFRSNLEIMKDRARKFRNSLTAYIK